MITERDIRNLNYQSDLFLRSRAIDGKRKEEKFKLLLEVKA